MVQLGVVLVVVWVLSLHYAIVSAHEDYVQGQARWERTEHLQSIVDQLRLRLEILEPVRLSLVESNPLVVSVETLGTRSGPFVIRADQAFIDSLSGGEIEAALAHELGRVWIYTHHPYISRPNGWPMPSPCASSAAPRWNRSTKSCGSASASRATSPTLWGSLRRLAEDLDDGRRHGAGVLERVHHATLEVDHVAGLDRNGRLTFDGQLQLTGQQREHVVGGVGVVVHAAHGAGLSPVAQHAELGPFHHHHRRNTGVAGNRAALFGTANGLPER